MFPCWVFGDGVVSTENSVCYPSLLSPGSPLIPKLSLIPHWLVASSHTPPSPYSKVSALFCRHSRLNHLNHAHLSHVTNTSHTGFVFKYISDFLHMWCDDQNSRWEPQVLYCPQGCQLRQYWQVLFRWKHMEQFFYFYFCTPPKKNQFCHMKLCCTIHNILEELTLKKDGRTNCNHLH